MCKDMFERRDCPTRTCGRLGIALLALYISVCWISTSHAQIARSWNAGNGDWSFGANWLPIGVPASNDAALIGNLAIAENATVTFDKNDTLATLNSVAVRVLFAVSRG